MWERSWFLLVINKKSIPGTARAFILQPFLIRSMTAQSNSIVQKDTGPFCSDAACCSLLAVLFTFLSNRSLCQKLPRGWAGGRISLFKTKETVLLTEGQSVMYPKDATSFSMSLISKELLPSLFFWYAARASFYASMGWNHPFHRSLLTSSGWNMPSTNPALLHRSLSTCLSPSFVSSTFNLPL